jgi:hypothetical protein
MNVSFIINEAPRVYVERVDVNGNTLIIVKDTEIIFEGGERFRISR